MGQVAGWGSASPRTRCLLSAASRRKIWCRIAIPKTGRQLHRRLVGRSRREWPARRIFAPSIAQSNRNSEHLSTILGELANTICLPEIGLGNWEPSRLGTDHIDLYQLHRPNLTIPIGEPMMERLVDEGKVRFIVVSNLSAHHFIVLRSRGGSAHSARQSGSDLRGAPTAW